MTIIFQISKKQRKIKIKIVQKNVVVDDDDDILMRDVFQPLKKIAVRDSIFRVQS